MMLLPSLILRAKIKSAGVLEVRWQYYSFVTSLSGKLHTEIPGVERDERKFEAFADEFLLGKLVKFVDGVSEGPRSADMLPRKSCKAR